MQSNDIEYLKMRARQASELADAAIDPAVEKIHRDMASAYAERITEVETRKSSVGAN